VLAAVSPCRFEADRGYGQEVACTQVPSEPIAVQVMQLPSQAVSQQTPPTQKPLRQPAADVQGCPSRCGCPQPLIETQLPAEPVAVQVMQLPVQAVSQQTPSTQKPLAHSAATWQEVPSGSEQEESCVHSPGRALQTMQLPVQAV
jgi:hypothetical protein